MDRSVFEQNVEALIADAETIGLDADALFERVGALAGSDSDLAIQAGEALLSSDEANRREMGVRLVGVAGELNRGRLDDWAKALLRDALRREAEIGPMTWAIDELGNLGDREALDLVMAHAHDADEDVRYSVAIALPGVSLTDEGKHDPLALAALRVLMTDEDGDVRDWATFGIGQRDDTDDEITREALFARLTDEHDEARMEAIVGMARRCDERVRPYLERELADPDHGEIFDEALEVLNGGYNYLAIEPEA